MRQRGQGTGKKGTTPASERQGKSSGCVVKEGKQVTKESHCGGCSEVFPGSREVFPGSWAFEDLVPSRQHCLRRLRRRGLIGGGGGGGMLGGAVLES